MTEIELKGLVKIAQENIPGLANRPDLETQNSDALDFIDVSVWGLKSALIAAYELGKSATQKQGRWVCGNDDQDSWCCSECGLPVLAADDDCTPYELEMYYCTRCGTKMMED